MRDAHEEARLLEAVYAAPNDDAPRAAYAAWLSAQGEPLGAFIAAQLDGDGAAAEASYPAAVASVPLPILGTPSLGAFKRGFLSGCITTGELALPTVEHEAWSLIEHLRLLEPEAVSFVAAGPRLSSLRVFETQRGEAVEALARTCPRVLEVLRIGVVESWFDVRPLIDDRTVVELGLAGAFELARDPGRVHLSMPALPCREGPIADVLRALVRPQDEVSFVWMGDRAPVDAVRRALEDIPHRVFTEHELAVFR